MRIPDGWALVVPPSAEEVAVTAKTLLRMANAAPDVRSQRGGREFLVPAELAQKYNKTLNRRGRAKKESSDG